MAMDINREAWNIFWTVSESLEQILLCQAGEIEVGDDRIGFALFRLPRHQGALPFAIIRIFAGFEEKEKILGIGGMEKVRIRKEISQILEKMGYSVVPEKSQGKT